MVASTAVSALSSSALLSLTETSTSRSFLVSSPEIPGKEDQYAHRVVRNEGSPYHP